MEEESLQHPLTDMERQTLVQTVGITATHSLSGKSIIGQDQESLSSVTSQQPHTADLEKTNAVVAAFTVVTIFFLLILETALSVTFMIFNANGDMQSVEIAHSKKQRKIYLRKWEVSNV